VEKSPDAFRTISEVADYLDTPAHVLRFWESRFPQIRPVKRAGGRRYYRPSDVALLAGIRRLLHDDGMTIRGVQKVLRDHGVRHVQALSGETVPDLPDPVAAVVFAASAGAAETAEIIPFAPLATDAAAPAGPPEPDAVPDDAPETAAAPPPADPDTPPAVPFTQPRATPAPPLPDLPLFTAPAPAAPPTAAALVARLRALPPGALAHRRAEVVALARRLAALLPADGA
jgi:DNA-binding transcriptional MerR regulator